MSTCVIAAMAIALQCACAGSLRRLRVVGAGLAVAVLVASCGGSTSTKSSTSAARASTGSAPSGWSGMGAPLSAFATAHPPQEGGGQPGGCGSSTFYAGPGQCCEFVDLSATLDHTRVTHNVLSCSAAIVRQGAGIFTPGLPPTLADSVVARNTPDRCFGC
jgi:hypothetical protein